MKAVASPTYFSWRRCSVGLQPSFPLQSRRAGAMISLVRVVMCAAAALSGVSKTSSIAFLPEGALSPVEAGRFQQRVAAVRSLRLVTSAYGRRGPDHRTADLPMGSKLVKPLHERRVRIADGFRAHFQAAAHLTFPPDARLRASALPDDLAAAVARAVEAGAGLAGVRQRASDALRRHARWARPISDRVNRALMPPTVYLIAGKVNTVHLAMLVDALGWPDRALVRNFLYGFPIVGDIPDSGVYRAVEPLESAALHGLRLQLFNRTAPRYNHGLHARLEVRRHASGRDRILDEAVANRTAKERARRLIVGPFETFDALHQHLQHKFPDRAPRAVYPRLMPRFAVEQKGDVRAIDDAKSNGANAATRMYETVATPSFVYPAVVARAAHEAAVARQIQPWQMVLSLADLAAAYRTVPTSQPWYTAFGYYDPFAEPPGPRYYYVPGHNFGLKSAVVNFNRLPELVVTAARAFGLVLADHFYDDFIVPDLAVAGRSGLDFIESLLLDVGPGAARQPGDPVRAPELDPAKTQEPAAVNRVLGVMADFSALHSEGVVRYRATPERVESVLDLFNSSFARRRMSPHESSRVRGKLYFLLSTAFASVGRAATLPLVQRQYRDVDLSFLPGSELHHALVFFRALLPRLPDLEVAVRPSTRPPLLVYTDAAFWEARKRSRGDDDQCLARGERLRGGLGAVVFDPEDATVRVAYARPDWGVLLSSWDTDQKTYIAELETLAAIAVYSTYPDLVRGRTVNHFIDNTVALSALVNGYAGKPSLAKPVNVFHLQTLGLRTRVYFEYVPSKANIADLPSRAAFAQLAIELRGYRVLSAPADRLVVPNIASWRAPLSHWVDLHDDGSPMAA